VPNIVDTRVDAHGMKRSFFFTYRHHVHSCFSILFY